jgi:two-component system response regulator FixJ
MTVIHIVDDEESVRSSLAFLLDIAGFSTATYMSASALLARVDVLEDGCVVTDLRMPDIDGVELLRRLRGAGATIPAIVVTGHADVQMAVEAIRQGAFDFIEKPFSDAKIISSINAATDKASREAEQRQSVVAAEILRTLTERELQVMRGMVDGLPNKVIAENLRMSPQLVEDHRTALMERMQVKTLPELVRITISVDWLHRAAAP